MFKQGFSKSEPEALAVARWVRICETVKAAFGSFECRERLTLRGKLFHV